MGQLLAMGPDGSILHVDPSMAEQYGGSAVWQNDDGTIWRQPDGGNDGTADFIRPDLRDAWNKDNQAKQAAMLNNNPAFKQFTPEQAAAYQNGGSAADLLAMSSKWAPTEHYGIYNDSMYGGKNMWFGPEAGPQHTDNGLGWGDIVTGGAFAPYSEQAQSGWNDMRTGLGVMALPFVGAGITAGLGAAGAGAAGAGAAEGGAAAGAGATGVDASTGLFAGESATSGAAGAGATGTVSGGAGSASLLGDASGDTLTGGTGAFDQGASQGVFDSAGNPIATSSDGGAFDMGGSQGVFDSQGNPTYSSPTTLASLAEQAKQMAAQFGITPASALSLLKSGLLKGAPAVLGAIGANQQANSLGALAKQYMDLGAPSRARYEASFAPGFTMASDPGYQDALDASSKATLHSLSVQGNPAGSPDAWSQSLADNYAKTAYPALQNFRNTNANAGGIASLQTAAPAAATGAITAQGNIFNAIGAGANDIFNPQPSLAQTLAQYQQLLKQQGSGAVQ